MITTPSAASTTVTGLSQGTFIFQLSINGGISTAKDTVIVNPVPPPTANAGTNQTIVLPATSTTLNGNGSTGNITSYSWTRISGPNNPTITSPASVSTTVTGLIQGTYVFQLSVNNGVSVSQVSETVVPAATNTTIFTTQIPPTTSGTDGSALELGIKFRTNVAGFINGIRFYKNSGNTGTHTGELYSVTGTRLAQAVFTGETTSGWQQVLFSSPVAITAGTTYIAAYHSSAGNYTSSTNYFTTAVTNGPVTALADGTDGSNGIYAYSASPAFPSSTFQKSNYWVDAVFSSTPPPPVANAGPNQIITLPTSSVTLNGNGSTGSISSYAWTQISGPNSATITTPTVVSPAVTGLIQGVYVFQLAVNGGASNSQVTITVNPAPPPTANAGTNQTINLPSSSITLNGNGSTGIINSYAWTQISGPNITTIASPGTVSSPVTGLIQGIYIFQLSVNSGASISQVTITVNAAPPPIANAGVNQTISIPASSTTLNAGNSTGVINSYDWTQISGPNIALMATPSAVSSTVNNLILGTYVFQISVNSGVSTAQVTVNVVNSISYTIFTTQIPGGTTGNDASALEVGVKFRSTVSGFITGIRFYKTAGNSGTHTGELYSSTGTRLAQAVFTGETSTGWQQVSFNTPVAINANTTYIASYFSSSGNYISTNNYYSSSVTNGPITALADGSDGSNGLYIYTNAPAFPVNSYQKGNYWVDVVFNTAATAPVNTGFSMLVTSPADGATNIAVNSKIFMYFNRILDPNSVTNFTVLLQNGPTAISASAVYNTADSSITLTPTAQLSAGTGYIVTVKGGTGANSVKNVSGNAMTNDSIWSFTTAPSSITSNPLNGPGGPILLISSSANPFSRYPVEILRAEGWNLFNALDVSAVTAAELNKYDVIIVGDFSLTAAQVDLLTNWVNAGGTIIVFHPDPQLAGLLGITPAGGTLSDKYLQVVTDSGPGKGIVNQTIQFHGPADLYTVNAGTNILARLYSDASTATGYPAVTSRSVGTLGGQAIAFTYDLAKSVIYTRQGNPAWVGQKRDGNIPPIRSDDLFFGSASFDPQPDWVDLNKVAIPQADEQQRLLTNIIMAGSYNHKPLPRFWFLPKMKKAAVVMTGDDHAVGGTIGRFSNYLTLSSSNTPSAVANWDAVRGTSYMYSNTPISNAQIAFFQNQGFEFGVHLNPDCGIWTPATLQQYFIDQAGDYSAQFPVAYSQVSHRIHCLAWSDWASLPKTELARGIRLNVSYYYWPDTWVNNNPGMFTGSGMPMRFADTDGSLIDSYQVPTQMTDESGQVYPLTISALLNKATGPEGYYGVFCANMHTDNSVSAGSDAIIQSAQALQIPVVSAKQMLDWIDGRNNSSFNNFTWINGQLNFTVTQDFKAQNLKGLLPRSIASGTFINLSQNGIPVNTTTDSIKGIVYILFDASNGNYVATYSQTGLTNQGIQANHLVPTADSVSLVPSDYLGQNYPNPSYHNTRINYSIARSGFVDLVLYDVQGRPVVIMVNQIKESGNYVYDLNTAQLAKGIYFYRMRSGNFSAMKKLIVQ